MKPIRRRLNFLNIILFADNAATDLPEDEIGRTVEKNGIARVDAKTVSILTMQVFIKALLMF